MKKGKGKNSNPAFLDGVVSKFESGAEEEPYTIEWNGGKSSSLWSESEVEWGVLLSDSIGVEIAKEFGEDGVFNGKVVDVSSGDDEEDEVLYRIAYQDGDSEDFDAKDLKEGQTLFQKRNKRKSPRRKKQPIILAKEKEEKKKDEQETENPNDDAKGRRSSPRKKKEPISQVEQPNNDGRRRRSRGAVNYAEMLEDNMDLDSDEEEIRQTRKRLKQSKNSSKKAKSKVDDEDFEDTFEEESDSHLLDDMIIDDDDDDDFEEEVKPKAWASSKKSKTKKKDVPAKTTKKEDRAEDTTTVDKEFEERLKSERKRVKPNNNPQKLPAAGSYVDPVGVDPTHGIVERIVSDQVRKVGGLLQRVQFQKDTEMTDERFQTELSYPIRLQTACSGTDAPSIALGLIKESLSKLCSKSEGTQKHKFDYEHMMSCEIEPFKQAYIARNFPGVPLFPDITKLSATNDEGEGEKVVDVYGRPQYIPEGDLFVAGTSCKDFSMLKTTKRKDIEQKGQSGETFLAAVEFLDLYQPPFAIFENVDGAPWGKMQEYIRGRINLAERNDYKAITSTKRKNSKYLWMANVFTKAAREQISQFFRGLISIAPQTRTLT